MKRHGNLFEQTFTREALFNAYVEARCGKRLRKACFWFDIRAGAVLDWLHRRLHDGSYEVRGYKRFLVHEPKTREICAPWFGDIVVQHAIYAVIRPLFERTFIDQSYACRIGKGTHKASEYAMEALRKSRPDSYTLKLDIRKFFYRIDRGILRQLIERKIKDKRLVDVMMKFAELPEPLGIPIGNLLSQIYALVYLNALDHFVKRELKVRLYCRYVDDFILFDLDREQCLEYKARIEAFLHDELHLELSKWTMAKTKRGVNFVGYRTWRRAKFIRKYSLFKFRRAAKRGKADSVISLLGHAKHSHSLGFMWRTIREVNPDLVRKPPSKVEVLNDVNGDLVCLYRVVQHHLDEFMRQFRWSLTSRQMYAWLRETKPDTLTDIQRAARFFYLQKLAFGGKVDGQTYGTSTTAPMRLNLLRLEEDLSAAHLRLHQVNIENLDWHACITRYDREHTLFFCDPPYYGTEGYGVEFGLEQYDRMAELLRTMKGKAAVTVNDIPAMRQAFKGLTMKSLAIRYTLGKSGAGRQERGELLVMNYKPGG